MSETPPVTFLVVCDPSVTESLAPAVATALRQNRHVQSVSPIRNTRPAQIAHDRAKAQLGGEITPIHDQLRSQILAACDAATEEIARVTDPGAEPSVDTSGEPTGPVPAQRTEPADTGGTRLNGSALPSRRVRS